MSRYLYFKYVNAKQYEINKQLGLNVKSKEDNFKIWYMKNIGYKHRKLHRFLKALIMIKPKISEYKENSLQFYGICSEKRYKKSLFKSRTLGFNVNSLLVEDYLDFISKKL